MNPDGAVQVIGLKTLRRTMRAAGEDLGELTALNRKAGEIVRGPARAGAPVRSGALAASVRVGATQTAAIIRAGTNARVPYAQPIHWGWYRRNIRPNPWITRAAQSTEPRWVDVYFTGMSQIIDRIRGK